MIAKRQNTSSSFHRVCETFTIFCFSLLLETLFRSLFRREKDAVFVNLRTRTGSGKLQTCFERVDVDVPNRSNSLTFLVVFLVAREPVQFINSFLLHNEWAPIGSNVIPLQSLGYRTQRASVCAGGLTSAPVGLLIQIPHLIISSH